MAKSRQLLSAMEKRRSWFQLYAKEFWEQASVQGVRLIVIPRRHLLERLFWFAIVLSSLLICSKIIVSSYKHYKYNPSVVTLEKNYNDWNNTFPASTICYNSKLNEIAAEDYISKTWGINESNRINFEYYKRFLNATLEMSVFNLDSFTEFENDPELNNITNDMEDIIIQLHKNITPIVYFNKVKEEYDVYEKVYTELGLCFSIGSSIAAFLKPSMGPLPDKLPQVKTCNALVHERCSRSEQIENANYSVKHFIHSPFEVPDHHDRPLIAEPFDSWRVFTQSFELLSSPEFHNLHLEQRKCFFPKESQNHGLRVKSLKLCVMSCRARRAYKLCNCVPIFYSSFEEWPVCNAKGLVCLSKYVNEWKDNDTNCKCGKECVIAQFTKVDGKTDNIKTSTYRNIVFIHTLLFSKTRYKRDVIYTFEDFVVSVGGTLALFLGFSMISAVELMYYFTIRPFSLWYKSRTTQTSEKSARREKRVAVILRNY